MTQLISDWSDWERAAFRKRPLLGRHNLVALESYAHLFSDEAIARLIDELPEGQVDFLTMGREDDEPESWKGGRRGGLTGAQILEAVRRGRLWINLRHVMNLVPEYAEAQKALFAELKALNPGYVPRNVIGSILISSPNAQVFYHADPGEVILWHLRGTKRFWVYPNTAPYLPDNVYEGLLLKENGEELPYEPRFEEEAQAFELTPGAFASWPHSAPHRIVNGPELNISITTEFTTMSSRIRYGAYYANGLLRRKLGMRPDFARMSAAERGLKFAMSVPLRALKLNRMSRQTHYDYFDVDLAAPDCVRPLASPIPVEERIGANA